uniref:non-specific serine/threonine protein kinase n=1 Tax=Thermosporothrix sp. COM3 TaxID=2490863 RepID=A0A455SBP2_9CHLR|nr:hypothetical protein KTC_06280 [Thermosporothrix sp. COM3]
MPALTFCSHCGAANETANDHCTACQQPLSAELSEEAPLLNDRYRLLTILGTGGYGAVYRAEDTFQANRLVAIKQVRLRGLSAEEQIEATETFHREVEVLSTLSHPRLPQYYEQFQDQGNWYVALEYLEGETLEARMKQRQREGHDGLDVEEVVRIGLQLCEVLTYLHSRQPAVIFRDLKPDNVMVMAGSEVALIDFGIARRYKPEKQRDTIPLGSPGYAAPEQYGKAQTSPQSDLYSLGALLYHLLTGYDPAENPFFFPPMEERKAPRKLRALIEQMTRRERGQRPRSAEEVAEVLRGVAEGLQQKRVQGRIWVPPQGKPLPGTGGGQIQLQRQLQTAARKQARRQVLISGVVLGTLACTGIGALIMSNSMKPKRLNERSTTEDQINKRSTAEDRDIILRYAVRTAYSADQLYLAVLLYYGEYGYYINIYEEKTFKEIKRLKVEERDLEYTTRLIWSPDNRYVAFYSGKAFLYWDWEASSDPSPVYINVSQLGDERRGVGQIHDTWPDKESDIVALYDHHLLVFDLNAEKQKAYLKFSDGWYPVLSCAWSLDKAVLAIVDATVGDVHFLDVERGRVYEKIHIAAAAGANDGQRQFYWTKHYCVLYLYAEVYLMPAKQVREMLAVNTFLHLRLGIKTFALSPDETMIAVSSYEEVLVWHIEQRRVIVRTPHSEEKPPELHWVANNRELWWQSGGKERYLSIP